jgi:heme/copper-type cytochrome/quinol oxidase subunit 3
MELETFEIETHKKTVLGFWTFLMADLILFTCLFTTYIVLRKETFGGPGPADVYKLDSAFKETAYLLFSSFTCGLAMHRATRLKKYQILFWFGITLILGAFFLHSEFKEFVEDAHKGHSWAKSGFFSGYYALVGTHGAHVTLGSLWIVIMICQILFKGLTAETFRRSVCLSLYWHFLDIIWIFIFTIVYLMGVHYG